MAIPKSPNFTTPNIDDDDDDGGGGDDDDYSKTVSINNNINNITRYC